MLWSCVLIANIPTTSPTLSPDHEPDGLSAGATVGIVIGVLMFVGLITTAIILCICCSKPKCPCYYKRRFRATGTVVVTLQAPQTLPAITNPKNTDYQPLSSYDPDTGY